MSQLNQKLVTTFTLNVAVVALFAVSLSFTRPALPLVVDGFVYATIFVFIMGVFVAARAYSATAWYRRPALALLRRHLATYGAVIMTTWVADEIVRALEENERLIDVKAGRVNWAIGLATLTAVMVGVTAAIHLGIATGAA